jgi:hypothetical protein
MPPPQDFFPDLHTLVHRVDRASLAPAAAAAAPASSPAPLLNALWEGCRSGKPVLRQAMQRLLWHCNGLLLGQLASWCDLVDPPAPRRTLARRRRVQSSSVRKRL